MASNGVSHFSIGIDPSKYMLFLVTKGISSRTEGTPQHTAANSHHEILRTGKEDACPLGTAVTRAMPRTVMAFATSLLKTLKALLAYLSRTVWKSFLAFLAFLAFPPAQRGTLKTLKAHLAHLSRTVRKSFLAFLAFLA